MQKNAYFDAMGVVARNKFIQMPQENVEVLMMNDGRIRVQDLPNLRAAMSMSHNRLINHLRYCPFSQYFG